MKNAPLYVPIVKTKRGELKALRKLDSARQSLIIPLVDIHRISKFPESKTKDSLDKHLEKIGLVLSTYWKNPAFIDFSTIDLTARTPNGNHPVEFFFRFNSNNNWIPVTGLDRDEAYLSACQKIVKTYGTELCIRLLEDDLEDPAETEEQIQEILNLCDLSVNECHLFMDLKYIVAEDFLKKKETAIHFINNFAGIKHFASLSLSSSSFPDSLVGNKNSTYKILRLDFFFWRAVLAEKKLVRKPIYSDYGVVNPNNPDLNPQAIAPSAKIRYTSTNDWIIIKGSSVRKGQKYGQFYSLSASAISLPEYRGKHYSWGDNFIFECATERKKTGNLERWVKVDTNHHITFVVDQIANIGV